MAPCWRSAVSGGWSSGGQAHYLALAWRVNYTVGGAGGLSKALGMWEGGRGGAEIVAEQHVKGVCGQCGEIHLTIVSHSSIFTPHV